MSLLSKFDQFNVSSARLIKLAY